MSPVACHLSPVTCQISIFVLLKNKQKSSAASWWRVCYEQGLPSIVLKYWYQTLKKNYVTPDEYHVTCDRQHETDESVNQWVVDKGVVRTAIANLGSVNIDLLSNLYESFKDFFVVSDFFPKKFENESIEEVRKEVNKKIIGSLTVVIPTLYPPPLSLTALGFFFGGGLFLSDLVVEYSMELI